MASVREQLPAPRLIVVSALLVISTITWRRGVYYSGGVDPVVAAKGLLNLIALALAMGASRAAGNTARYRLSSVSIWILLLMLAESMLGAAYTSSTLFSSLVLSVRLIILAMTVYCLLRAYPVLDVIRAIAISMAFVAAVGVATGLGSISSGRLSGGIPPLNPNEITGLCGVVVLVLIWRNITHGGRRWDLPVILVLLGLVWLTQSRTGLIALAVAAAVLVLQARRLSAGPLISLLATVPILYYVLVGTSTVSDYLNRGGAANVTTLNNRTVAWSAAIELHKGFWDTWFGSGLSLVQIPVTTQYRTQQILDSSWLSALVQSGLVGIAMLGAWVLTAVVVALRSPRPYRLLATALLAFCVSRSVLESGLIGATPIFLLLFLISTRQLEAVPAARALTPRTDRTASYPRIKPQSAALGRSSAFGTSARV